MFEAGGRQRGGALGWGRAYGSGARCRFSPVGRLPTCRQRRALWRRGGAYAGRPDNRRDRLSSSHSSSQSALLQNGRLEVETAL